MHHVGKDFSKKAANNTEGAIWDYEIISYEILVPCVEWFI